MVVRRRGGAAAGDEIDYTNLWELVTERWRRERRLKRGERDDR